MLPWVADYIIFTVYSQGPIVTRVPETLKDEQPCLTGLVYVRRPTYKT